MGAGWRRFTERLHQTGPALDRGFTPTSNARCSALLREASTFASQLRKCERAVRGMAAANADAVRCGGQQLMAQSLQSWFCSSSLLQPCPARLQDPCRPPHLQVDTIRAVMSAPLPLQYEETAVGGGGAAGLLPIGGDAFSPHAITGVMQVGRGWRAAKQGLGRSQAHTMLACAGASAAATRTQRSLPPLHPRQETTRKLESEVLAPLSRWLEMHAELGVSPACRAAPQVLRGSPLAAVCGRACTLPALPPTPSPQARCKDLEALRLELDSRRRTVAELTQRCGAWGPRAAHARLQAHGAAAAGLCCSALAWRSCRPATANSLTAHLLQRGRPARAPGQGRRRR